jgi:hypothetical protein
MENYTPKVHENGKYVEMLIEAKKCKCCEKIMIPELGYHSIFPKFNRINQEAQMKAGGFVYSTSTLVDDKPICLECEQAGKADFLCQLCNERKTSDKKEESFGYPSDFLCKDCYETKSAKIWDEKCNELMRKHQYDFE